MIAVTLKKVPKVDLKVLQEMVQIYTNALTEEVNPHDTASLYNYLQEVDILQRVYLVLRSKIESATKEPTFKLKASEAVELAYACAHCAHTTNPANNLVSQTYRNTIDEQLNAGTIIKPSAVEKIQLTHGSARLH